MDEQDAIVAHLNRLDRRITRIGGTTLGLLALGLFAAMAFQDPETVSVQNIVRTQRLELTNANGEVVAILTGAEQEEGVVTAYYDNGVKMWQVPVRNNVYEGKYVRWDQLGIKLEEGEYKEGVRHGLWRFWDSDRVGLFWGYSYLHMQGAFANSLRTGIWTDWHTADQKESEGEWQNDHMVGPWTFWNEDGSIDEERTGFYENDVKIR